MSEVTLSTETSVLSERILRDFAKKSGGLPNPRTDVTTVCVIATGGLGGFGAASSHPRD